MSEAEKPCSGDWEIGRKCEVHIGLNVAISGQSTLALNGSSFFIVTGDELIYAVLLQPNVHVMHYTEKKHPFFYSSYVNQEKFPAISGRVNKFVNIRL